MGKHSRIIDLVYDLPEHHFVYLAQTESGKRTYLSQLKLGLNSIYGKGVPQMGYPLRKMTKYIGFHVVQDDVPQLMNEVRTLILDDSVPKSEALKKALFSFYNKLSE